MEEAYDLSFSPIKQMCLICAHEMREGWEVADSLCSSVISSGKLIGSFSSF